MRGVFVLLVLVAPLATVGCGGAAHATGEKTVVAAFYPLSWLATEVGGPNVRVVDLTPAGAEPHDIELTPRDVEQIHDADLVLYLGHGFQPAVEKAVRARLGPSLDLLARQTLRSAGGSSGNGGLDPHVWLDPTRLAQMATAVGRALARPRAAARLVARLDGLDRVFRRGLASCTRHDIVTSHAAFGYLARRYHLRQVALAGLSPEAEPGPRDLERFVHEVETSGAKTVFVESLVSPRLADTVAREAGVGTATLDPLEGLTPRESASGADYVSVMRADLGALRKALGCR
jgi:zinc transport system substrate-binding protein